MNALNRRIAMVGALMLLASFITFSNFIDKEKRLESAFLVDDGLRLGLDLQGGIHWVLGVELETALKRELEFQRDSLVEFLEEDGVVPSKALVGGEALQLSATNSEDAEKIRAMAVETNILNEEGSSGNDLNFVLTDEWKQEIRERTMLQVLEVLRRRIDDPVTGIPESVVTRQGSDRVLVQIPGGAIDRERASQIVKSTGFLEFKIVRDIAKTKEELLERHPTGLPEGTKIEVELDPESKEIVNAYLVPEVPDITGDYLEDARVGRDSRQLPAVDFTFNSEGGQIFGELTSKSIGKSLAIILDNNVYSAPTIQSRISLRGQITGRFSPREVANLAIVLRAGSLSVPVVIEEERTIGPALGQDSIDRGARASVIGLLLVVFAVAFYYKMSGVYASIALTANLILLAGVMTLFGATLTLPGIAGLVLTVGMAVDANVIIFERIREELRVGKSVRAAVATGFDKAFWTVVDANLKTVLPAMVLSLFGTGPIKGFAVTLSIGIVTSVFSALVVTRLLFQIYPGARKTGELSI